MEVLTFSSFKCATHFYHNVLSVETTFTTAALAVPRVISCFSLGACKHRFAILNKRLDSLVVIICFVAYTLPLKGVVKCRLQ